MWTPGWRPKPTWRPALHRRLGRLGSDSASGRLERPIRWNHEGRPTTRSGPQTSPWSKGNAMSNGSAPARQRAITRRRGPAGPPMTLPEPERIGRPLAGPALDLVARHVAVAPPPRAAAGRAGLLTREQ